MELTQAEVSIAAMIGRLEGSADSLDNINANYFDASQGLVIGFVARASSNLRSAARELHAVMQGKASIKELADKDDAYPRLLAEREQLVTALRDLVALSTVLARESADRAHNGDEGIDPARALLRQIGEAE